MSKAETLLRIKEAEAQIRTVKEAAEREREQVLRVARREALELIDKARQEAEDRYREILASAAELSENLVKLRSIANILALKAPPKAEEAVRIDEMREKILTLELNITEEDEARKKATALLSDLDRRIEELRPFADLGLPLEAYRGYESVGVLVGRITKDVSEADLDRIPVELVL